MANTVKSHFGFHEFRTGEPSLDDLFAEPIVQLVMERDRINAQDMRLEFDRMLANIAG